jgi:hypothetical protein
MSTEMPPVIQDIREWLTTIAAKQNLELGTERDLWKSEAERLASGYDELKEKNEYLIKVLSRVYDSLEREYWSEYAGLDETRAILDAVISSPENP